MTELSSVAPNADPLSHDAMLALRRVVMVAWLAIALGFAMEALTLAGRLAAGSHPATTLILIELAQGVTWAFFVCAGLSLGLPRAITTGLNEIVFPIGCALVVYIALQVGRHMKIISGEVR
ncbi:MAG: hypothetical protein EOS08_00910 [Mesorhizobium sp.]|nr:MAG: hypothetical protein EOS08_00910 [Mesorhizobium sp.]